MRSMTLASGPPAVLAEIAFQLARLGDDSPPTALTPIISDLALRLSVNGVSLASIRANSHVTYETEWSAPGAPPLGTWFDALPENERQHTLSTLIESAGKPEGVAVAAAESQHARVLAFTSAWPLENGSFACLVLRGNDVVTLADATRSLLCDCTQLFAFVLERMSSGQRVRARQDEWATLAVASKAVMSLAHEFNNVLYTIQCVTDVLQLDIDRASQTHADLEEIKKATHRGATLTRQLLALSKTNDSVVRQIDLRETLSTIAPLLRRILGPQNPLNLDLPTYPVRTITDQGPLERLLIESVVEARRSAGTTRELCIALAARDSALTDIHACSTFDLVIGANNEDAFWSFTETQELRNSIATLVKLGATAAPVGNSISLTFQLAGFRDEHFSAPQRTGHPARAATLTTLLLVEDEDIARHATAKLLAAAGYQVLQAENRADAIDLLSRTRGTVAALITDVKLPDGDGLSLSEHYRLGNADGKVIFISGLGPAVLGRVSMSESSYRFLQKPYRASELRGVLQQVLATDA